MARLEGLVQVFWARKIPAPARECIYPFAHPL